MTDPDAELRAWAPEPTDPTLPAEGMRLAGYSDFALVAEGGEGTVYRARQDGLDRFVAVKVINVDDPARLARFRRELEITVRLGRQHPHIVTVLDTATAPDGRPCIVMEYYDAGSLHDRLRSRGPLPVADVVAAGVAVADALAFAHEHGFLHRDVKPQNILVLPTSYVLADFGIARMADAGHTTSLQLVSYRHAAPQMIDGEEPSALDDLWSLGSTLFTLLDGEPPFAAVSSESSDTMLSYLGRVRSAEPRQLRRSDVPTALAEVLTRCLSKRREDRFPNAGALRMALAAIDTSTQGWTPSLPIGDFGPRPTPYVPEPALPEPPPPNDRDRTVAGAGSELAGLTVRLPESPVPDFGPLPPAEVAVLPPSVQWRQDEDLTAPGTPAPAPRKRLWLLGLAAVLVGGAVGVALTVLNGQDDNQATPPPTTTTTQETTSPPPAAPTITGGDPAFAPTLTRLDDNGDTITLTWTDPTAGNLQFVVVDTTTDDVTALATATAGSTTYTVTGLDPDADRYCYRILGIGLDDPTTQRGASDSLCTDR